MEDRARECRVERAVSVRQPIDTCCVKHNVRDLSLPGERPPMGQGVLAEVDTNRSAWRHRLGEIDGLLA